MKKGSFFENKGFYIILFLCVAAIGASGYVSFFSPSKSEDQSLKSTPTQIVETTPEDPVVSPEVIEKEDIATSNKTDVKKEDIVPETVKQEVSKPKEQLYLMPVDGEVIFKNSMGELVLDETMNDWRVHHATDFSAKTGAHVVAIADGTVRSIVHDDLYGTIITIEHEDGIITKTYGLADKTTAKIDKKVVAGDVIGTVLGTFPAEEKLGEHIHVEVLKDGENFDLEALYK